jgi:hypothetical protein
MLTLQEYADTGLDPAYQQPLKTLPEAVAVQGWLIDSMPDDLVCCGESVKSKWFLGNSYLAYCPHCLKFVYDVTGPSFGNSGVNVVDPDKVDLETDSDRRWIASVYIGRPDSNAAK